MPRKPIDEYRFSPAAQTDLDKIWDYTAEIWSPEQAESYLRGLGEKLEVLCSYPEIARERLEIDPPVRLHPYRSHLIIYRIESTHLAIVRVVHNRQRWQALLSE
ncbi:type II toxin-antitoxin system RelE/ParE family toxin [Ruegeria jejuensis]|uniref:type II toxin-antitoxin system RelE/ParE family toxin n=1 Tax=Ruegeria jejuensis TaxID=3233338 RepID=UPI00355C06B3